MPRTRRQANYGLAIRRAVGSMQRLRDLYGRNPRLAAVLAGLALLAGLTAVHSLIAFTSAFRVLYVLPIWLATRMGGRRAGIVLVALGTVANTLTEWQMGHGPNETILSNLIIRFVALTLLMLLIAQVEQGLQKHQRLALTDPLTGLMNRHAFKEFANGAFDRALLRRLPTTVVVIDCDGFKQLNDAHGHQAGDHVLTMLARALETETRQTDLVARLGGDEFAIVFQNTTPEEARQIMHRVDEAFVRAAHDAGYDAALSIGHGSSEEGGHELDRVLDLADRAMYEHKRAKRAAAFLN